MKIETFMQNLIGEYDRQNAGRKPKTMLIEYDVQAKELEPGYELCRKADDGCFAFDLCNIIADEDIIHSKDRKAAESLFDLDRSSNAITSSRIRIKKNDGSYRYYELTTKAVNSKSGDIEKLMLIICDVDEELRYKREFYRMVNYDKLTGLFSAEGFYRAAKTFMEGKIGNYIIVRIDVRDFFVANAGFGLENSERILKSFAQEISDIVGPRGVIGRIAGDVFAICIQKEDFLKSEFAMLREGKFKASDFNYEFELVSGVYEAGEFEKSVAKMCYMANIAMCEAKNSEKNIVHYEKDMHDKYFQQRKLMQEKDEALKNGQFKVYLQPQCLLEDGKIESAEALVRWEHPERGLLSPNEFIPLFEKNGFITKLDEYMIEEVCKLLAGWKDKGKKMIPVSVNISRIDLFDTHMCNRIKAIADKYDIDPKYIELELTETAYMDKPELMKNMVDCVREFGFKVLMDDFGSGYSSLNMLKDLPVDKLKIDLKFMDGLTKNIRSSSIVQFIVNMAKALEISTIAEGLEEDEQVEILSEFGCDLGQGYIFSKPIPICEFERTYITA